MSFILIGESVVRHKAKALIPYDIKVRLKPFGHERSGG